MRLAAAIVALPLVVPTLARAADHDDAPRRTLNGHTFMIPASFDSAFVQTTFVNRTSARREQVSDVPIGPLTADVESLGVREEAGFEQAIGELFSVGAGGFAQFASGTSGQALATQGALYAYGLSANGAFRIFRIEETGTQLNARLELFGVEGGGRLSLLPFLSTVRNSPIRTIPDVVTNVGELLTIPASWWGFAGSINVAQAFTRALSLQASFRLDIKRFTQSPFVPGQGRVDMHSTSALPQGAVAFGVNPPEFPVAFLLEYRVASQDSLDPTSLAHHLLALGGYYSCRSDLQLGPVLFAEFGLPPIQGFDNNGDRVPSQRGTAFSAQLMMQYFW